MENESIFSYAKHFNKWNNGEEKVAFGSFALWCIHTKEGQEFIKKAVRNGKDQST